MVCNFLGSQFVLPLIQFYRSSMYILSVGSWLFIILVSVVYFICLIGVTVENLYGLVDRKVLKCHNILLLLAGVMWLWSNMGVGLISLLVCSISYSIRDIRSVGSNPNHHWEKFNEIVCLLQSIVGVLWLWSHIKLLLYLSLFAFAAYVIVIMFCFAGIWRRNSAPNQENMVVDPPALEWGINVKWIIGSIIVMVKVLTSFKSIYEVICKKIWRSVYHSILHLGSPAAEISIRSSTVSVHHHNNEGGTSSSSSESMVSARSSSWQATIGQNVNNGGTQTIGSIRIGEYVLQIQANRGRDIIFNTYIAS